VGVFDRAYHWTLDKAGRRTAPAWLAAVSFAESSFFPIPPDLLLIPMVLARPRDWWRLSLLCTVSSVIGGLLGYAIGYSLYEAVGRPIIHFYGLEHQFASFVQMFQANGGWILVAKGMTPIPYKLLTITSGVARLDLGVFIGASVLSRSLRFIMVAGLLRLYGERARGFVEKRLTLFGSLFVALLIGGFVLLKFL
jgi:membrane protein YqaA with SNARE-associated domain